MAKFPVRKIKVKGRQHVDPPPPARVAPLDIVEWTPPSRKHGVLVTFSGETPFLWSRSESPKGESLSGLVIVAKGEYFYNVTPRPSIESRKPASDPVIIVESGGWHRRSKKKSRARQKRESRER